MYECETTYLDDATDRVEVRFDINVASIIRPPCPAHIRYVIVYSAHAIEDCAHALPIIDDRGEIVYPAIARDETVHFLVDRYNLCIGRVNSHPRAFQCVGR